MLKCYAVLCLCSFSKLEMAVSFRPPTFPVLLKMDVGEGNSLLWAFQVTVICVA